MKNSKQFLIFFNNKDYFIAAKGKAFDEERLRQFLTSKGIAVYDTAEEIIRHKGNASDLFLEIVKPTDLKQLLSQIPQCNTIVTTGQKATETLMTFFGMTQTPSVGGYVEAELPDITKTDNAKTEINQENNRRTFRCYRMPSSSRAYPKSLSDKAADYRKMFTEVRLLKETNSDTIV